MKQLVADKKKLFFTLLYILGTLLMLTTLQQIIGEQTSEIPYNTFLTYLSQDRIVKVAVGDTRIEGYIKPAKDESTRGYSVTRINGERVLTKKFITVRIYDEKLVERLLAKDISFEGYIESTWLKDLLFMWILPLGALVLIWGFFLKRMGRGGGILSIGKNKARVYADEKPNFHFQDAAGVDEVIEELKEIVEYLRNSEKFSRLGGKIPKGVLLVGPPGTGKTLLAKTVAGEAERPFFSLSGTDFVEMFVGVGAARVRDLFDRAVEIAPCIIFIDEIDALGKSRGMYPFGGHDEREQTLNQLLVEMDGFEPNKGVIIIGATNRPEVLDLALLRPGRFDRIIVVDRPDIKGREEILKVHARNVKLASEVDLRIVAARTPGFVGADLANIINEAALLAARSGKSQIMMEDLEEAIDRVVAGLMRKNRVLNQREKEIVAYHEAGHAIVATIEPTDEEVHRISIIPRGVAALGHTLQLPTEDRYLMTKKELLSKMKVLLGGRIAEELIFGEISTGAQNDLERVTQIARSMVLDYGMSEKLGPLTYRDKKSTYLDYEMEPRIQYSQETAKEIDAEIRSLINEAYNGAHSILCSRLTILKNVAQTLLSKEIIEGDELRKLLEADTPLPNENNLPPPA